MSTQTPPNCKDQLIMVDEADREIGYASREDCHLGQGRLHRAFSVLLFNDAGELLLQKRSPAKLLWPNYWSNSCCSHPRRGETTLQAAHRRMREELGISCELEYLYKFQYHTAFRNIGSENEICSVYWGSKPTGFMINESEISDWRFVAPKQLDREMRTTPNRFTPWFKMEWSHVSQSFHQRLFS